MAIAEPERSIKSIRDYQVGVVFADEFGRQTPVQTHETGVLKVAKTRAEDYNGLNAKLNEYNYPEWATHYKYYIKENANEYYNLAMDRYYDAEDGNIWLSFPSSERSKVDEETFLILKKQHDTDVFVRDKARYKILAIENEAPEFIKTKKDSKGIVSIGAFPSSGEPKINQYHFDLPSSYFDSSGTFAGVNASSKETLVRISNATNMSNWYDVANIASFSGNKRITVRKPFSIDMAFTTDDGLNSGNLVSPLSVQIAEKKEKNLAEFEGRFFVKIYNPKKTPKTPFTKIQGYFIRTESGYNLELRFPINMLGNKLGFAVVDIDTKKAPLDFKTMSTSNLNNPSDLGSVLVPSPEINRILKGTGHSGSRIWVVDNHHRVLAQSGTIQNADGVWADGLKNQPPKNAWQRFEQTYLHPLYYKILTRPENEFIDTLHDVASMQGSHLANALKGQPASSWRLTPDSKAVILSAASPIWIEDKVENANLGAELGLETLLMEHGHNMNRDLHEDVTVVKDWKGIYEYLHR